ncbi:UDP-N-acetylmuramoyl-L-alanyl-D-glutamate--2,6-diaminopimelate ligase [Isoalcanivorax indicus]|uniref:UDP-N-acetylmuramoyl-L-alanyl-D-glutamate--2, 6-diaminopimelate ligase n=1 Tax=Isoalcanivorax indicus TaxID=2202653 RepID=UPI000DB947AD|nr:UDP-N-acetylmuramoyl-L-alanyl-D-glutamate--2,6-diaminopimelate ligase [Isoalcanivorax indicus]
MSLPLQQLLPERTLPTPLAALPVNALCLDSRRVQRGDTFVALAGHARDGRTFIRDAIAAGAALVLAEHDDADLGEEAGVPVIGVPALRQHLGVIAARLHGEPGQALSITGVTGTNGKTSTTWFLADALNAAGLPCALIGTLGVRFADISEDLGHTTPDPVSLQAALARCRDAGAQQLVMEVSSHALDQGRLNGTPVAVAVFTNLSRDHLDYHGSEAAYFDAKAKLFALPSLRHAVINIDDAAGRRMLALLPAQVNAVTCGQAADATVQCSAFDADEAGMRLSLQVAGERVEVARPLYGAFNRDNLMAVAGVLHALGLDAAQISAGMNAVTPVPGRMEPVQADPMPVGSMQAPRVLVDYAHTPDGLEKALQAARVHFPAGRLFCVIGCGGDRDRGKRPQMAAVAEALADQVVLTSDNPRFEEPEAILAEMRAGLAAADQAWVISDRREAITAAINAADIGDLVLIAGKGHETYQEIRGQRYPLDDRALARTALTARTAP